MDDAKSEDPATGTTTDPTRQLVQPTDARSVGAPWRRAALSRLSTPPRSRSRLYAGVDEGIDAGVTGGDEGGTYGDALSAEASGVRVFDDESGPTLTKFGVGLV